MTAPRILAFAGSLRRDSFNKKLARVAADAARAAGGEVTYVDLADLRMPIYDGDLEKAEGIPPEAKRFKELMLANDALIIASPEYNSSIPGTLKNVLDWVSRSEQGEPPLAAYAGKVGIFMSASPGPWGAIRSLGLLRMMLGNIKVLVLPDFVSIARAGEAFNPDGSLKDAKQAAAVQKLGKTLTDTLAKLK